MQGEAIVVPLSPDSGDGAEVTLALAAGAAEAEASAALEQAGEAQAEATAAIAEGAAVASRVDLIGNDVLALSQRISTVEGMVGQLTGTLLDAINAAMADEEAAADVEPDIVPVVDEAPAEALPHEASAEEAPAEPEPEEPVKEEKKHAAPKRKRYGFRK